jgi:hypothetical protein
MLFTGIITIKYNNHSKRSVGEMEFLLLKVDGMYIFLPWCFNELITGLPKHSTDRTSISEYLYGLLIL